MKRKRMLAVLAAATLLLAGCGQPDDASGPEEPSPPEEETRPGEDEGTTPAQEHHDERVAEAADDLAERVGVEPGQVQVAEYRAVTWPDGAVGCPEEGMAYTQALVDGYLLVLQAEGTEFSYHSAGEEEFFYCDDPQDPAEDGYA